MVQPPTKLKQRISRSLGLSLWFFKDLVLRPPILETVKWFNQKSSLMGWMGTSLFNWTNESPLFFRGPSVSRWHTSSRRALEGRLWRGRCGSALFTNTTWPCEVSQRWEPEVWNSQALPVLPFFIDGCSPPRSAQYLAGFQTLDRPDVPFELR